MRSEREQQIDDRVRLGVQPTGSAKAAPGSLPVTGHPATPAELPGLMAKAVDGLDAPQQRAAAEGVIGAISSDAKQDLAASVVRGLDTVPQQRAAAQQVVEVLPADQQQRLAEGLLGPLDGRTRERLWYMIVGALSSAIFVFGLMAFVLIYQEKAAEAPLALATTALGGIVGLIATSPATHR